MTKLDPHFKLWLNVAKGKDAIGTGKCLLLQAIDEQGSITKACEKLNISYRKAWGDIKQLEQNLNIKLVEKTRGGQKGGHTELTEKAKLLIKAYAKTLSQVEQAMHNAYEENMKDII